MSKRAVVTGGAGFLGSHLCEQLIGTGWEVVCIDNFVTGSEVNIARLLANGRFSLVRADLTNGIDIDGRVDVVYHLASPASPVHYQQFPLETLRVGSIGTWRALDLACGKGATFFFASSSEVYGEPLMHPQREDYWGNVNPIGPRSVYDEAKRFSEAAVVATAKKRRLDAAIARIFNTFGPRFRVDDGRVIPTFINQALRGEPLSVAGDGSQTRTFCYVQDTVSAITRAAERCHLEPINVGGTEELTVLDVAHMVRDLVGSNSEIVHMPRPTDDPNLRKPDLGRAWDLLEWRPKVAVKDGIRETIKWYRERM